MTSRIDFNVECKVFWLYLRGKVSLVRRDGVGEFDFMTSVGRTLISAAQTVKEGTISDYVLDKYDRNENKLLSNPWEQRGIA